MLREIIAIASKTSYYANNEKVFKIFDMLSMFQKKSIDGKSFYHFIIKQYLKTNKL